MTCPNCEAIVAEGVQFCPNCGYNFSPEGKNENPKEEKKKNNIKLIFSISLVVIIVILIVTILSLLSGSKGEKISATLSDELGKSIAMAEKNSNVELLPSSDYAILKNVVNYDYIVEADKAVKVEGINLPEWAVFIQNDSNSKIDKITYYNFKALQRDWKGQKTSKQIDTGAIEYGMNYKQVEKIVPVTPLAITRSNDDVTTYLYKYYFVDEETKNDKAYYLTVSYDMDDKVKSITSKENDFISFIFK